MSRGKLYKEDYKKAVQNGKTIEFSARLTLSTNPFSTRAIRAKVELLRGLGVVCHPIFQVGKFETDAAPGNANYRDASLADEVVKRSNRKTQEFGCLADSEKGRSGS